MENTSSKYSLNKTDLYKVLRGGLVTVAGTALAYFASIYMQIDWTVHYGSLVLNLNAFLIPLFGALIELARRFLSEYK